MVIDNFSCKGGWFVLEKRIRKLGKIWVLGFGAKGNCVYGFFVGGKKEVCIVDVSILFCF